MRRKNLIWISLIALLLTTTVLTATVSSPAPAKMEVDPPLVEAIYPPLTFTLNITVSAQNLYAWEFTLSFVPSLLQALAVTEGDFLASAGSTLFSYSIDNTNGHVTAFAMLLPFPAEGASGAKGVVATIEFQAIGFGVCDLDLWDTELYTLTGGALDPIYHAAKDGLFDNRPEKAPPHAIFSAPSYGCEGVPVTFNASASNDDDDFGWIVSYEWDFGYGPTDSGMVVEHAFPGVGTYTVSLTVTDNDGFNDTATIPINVVTWMEGGWFPDILGARPEREPWNEVAHGREIGLFGLIGNPTNDTYDVYVEFTVYSTEAAAKLGTVTTDPATIGAGETLELSALMDLRDLTWRVAPNRGPYWSLKNLVQPSYTVIGKCYHRIGAGEFEEGFAAEEFGFKVRGAKHDIAVLEIAANPEVPQGDPLEISVTVANEGGGHFVENFNITVTYKGLTASGTVEVRESYVRGAKTEEGIRTETFTWDTTGLPTGRYLLTATLSILTFEMDTLDNVGSCLVEIT